MFPALQYFPAAQLVPFQAVGWKGQPEFKCAQRKMQILLVWRETLLKLTLLQAYSSALSRVSWRIWDKICNISLHHIRQIYVTILITLWKLPLWKMSSSSNIQVITNNVCFILLHFYVKYITTTTTSWNVYFFIFVNHRCVWIIFLLVAHISKVPKSALEITILSNVLLKQGS